MNHVIIMVNCILKPFCEMVFTKQTKQSMKLLSDVIFIMKKMPSAQKYTLKNSFKFDDLFSQRRFTSSKLHNTQVRHKKYVLSMVNFPMGIVP